MADTKLAPGKIAMSKALGAAFLNHQVEQLEKSVHTGSNWRDRRTPDVWRGGETKRNASGAKVVKKRSDEAERDWGRQAEGQRAEREERRSADGKGHKDADIVVVDATVLIHGLYHLKRWCRDGREETVIVPLEALNTLDLLKKGTSALAQRARAASRILEAQVGTNPRIRVQQDDAFVPWDSIAFDAQTAATLNSSPEWVRRTICCARWELEHATEGLADEQAAKAQPRVVLAVVAPSPDTQVEPATPAPISASPVPLPAPQPNRYESRLSAALVTRWATKAGLEVLELSSAPPHASAGVGAADAPAKGRRSGEARRSGEEERAKRTQAGRGRRNSRGTTPGARPPSMASGTGLVERPQAVMTMMEMVTQPNRVVRVLARGEKLDP
ncbi:hypothetical protein C8T65DRAFT_709110 [Cerioporus squamosus]|nr:hypothetical protein C8T65DRAFT_709110 [Cerioporus squamosus]